MDSGLDGALVLQCLVFVLAAGSFLAAAAMFSGRDTRVFDRFRQLSKEERDRYHPAPQNRGMLKLLTPLLPSVPAEALTFLIPNDGATRTRLQAQLVQAGIYSPGALATFVTAKLLLTTAPPIVCGVLSALGLVSLSNALLVGGLIGTVGMLLPGLWLARRRSRRHVTLRRSLADFLDLIVTCLEGGLGMPAALKCVADELQLAHADLSAELQIVLGEMELGRSVDQALGRLGERTGLEELRTVSTFVQQAGKFGTPLGDAMRQLADMLRQQREHRAEELAQQAAVKILFPTLLFIFPTIFVVLAGPAAIQIREGLSSDTPHSPATTTR